MLSRINEVSRDTQQTAAATRTQLTRLDTTIRHQGRLIEQNSRDITDAQTNTVEVVVERVQPQIRELAAQDIRLGSAVDQLETTALGMATHLTQIDNILFNMNTIIRRVRDRVET